MNLKLCHFLSCPIEYDVEYQYFRGVCIKVRHFVTTLLLWVITFVSVMIWAGPAVWKQLERLYSSHHSKRRWTCDLFYSLQGRFSCDCDRLNVDELAAWEKTVISGDETFTFHSTRCLAWSQRGSGGILIKASHMCDGNPHRSKQRRRGRCGWERSSKKIPPVHPLILHSIKSRWCSHPKLHWVWRQKKKRKIQDSVTWQAARAGERRDANMHRALIIFLSTCQDRDRARNQGHTLCVQTICNHPHSVTVRTERADGQRGSWESYPCFYYDCSKWEECRLQTGRTISPLSGRFLHISAAVRVKGRWYSQRTHVKMNVHGHKKHAHVSSTYTHTRTHLQGRRVLSSHVKHAHPRARSRTHTHPSCSPPSSPALLTSRLAPAAGRGARFERPTCRRCSTSGGPRLSLPSQAG